jgi:hypothetical protein
MIVDMKVKANLIWLFVPAPVFASSTQSSIKAVAGTLSDRSGSAWQAHTRPTSSPHQAYLILTPYLYPPHTRLTSSPHQAYLILTPCLYPPHTRLTSFSCQAYLPTNTRPTSLSTWAYPSPQSRSISCSHQASSLPGPPTRPTHFLPTPFPPHTPYQATSLHQGYLLLHARPILLPIPGLSPSSHEAYPTFLLTPGLNPLISVPLLPSP